MKSLHGVGGSDDVISCLGCLFYRVAFLIFVCCLFLLDGWVDGLELNAVAT